MNNFSFIIRNVIANEFTLLENLLMSENIMDEVSELDNIKNKLMELEKKVRMKKWNK